MGHVESEHFEHIGGQRRAQQRGVFSQGIADPHGVQAFVIAWQPQALQLLAPKEGVVDDLIVAKAAEQVLQSQLPLAPEAVGARCCFAPQACRGNALIAGQAQHLLAQVGFLLDILAVIRCGGD